ncbi:hypothetical protein GCM10007977_084220 [Dactylosporangium sucinum]|uniref:IS6 family transposase n=1 Tax=Dactylosporangium sucinum TaxID=1424081 RepID=A0A917X5X2_9ACTN|nr:hypothetical protein GCM10007977_084220 [Dactylosporangium sucinum]
MVAVRWYLRYGLSWRNVEELLVERGVEVDHVTVFRWVQRSPATGRRRPVRSPYTRGQVVCRSDVCQGNLRRGHYELAVDAPPAVRVAVAFTEVAKAT